MKVAFDARFKGAPRRSRYFLRRQILTRVRFRVGRPRLESLEGRVNGPAHDRPRLACQIGPGKRNDLASREIEFHIPAERVMIHGDRGHAEAGGRWNVLFAHGKAVVASS